MTKKSAGILPFRRSNSGLQVLLVHPGGPFWQSRDLAAWSIAKGEYGEDEQPEAAARREFAEEPAGSSRGHRCFPSGNCASVAASSSPPSLSKAISTQALCAATCSKWNGRRAVAARSPFRRSIAVSGWTSPTPGKRYLQASGPSSIGLWRPSRQHGQLGRDSPC
jgi:hypothetical protein